MTSCRVLTKSEFLACTSDPMRDVTGAQEPTTDIWPYVNQLIPRDFGVEAIRDVELVYRDATERFDHVLISTDQGNVYSAIIVDRGSNAVFGHHLLDLNIEYGIVSLH